MYWLTFWVSSGASSFSGSLNQSQEIVRNSSGARIKSLFAIKIKYPTKVHIFILYLCTKYTKTEDEEE